MTGTVVKVGGSLGRGDDLRCLCRRLAQLGRRHSLLLVPGGGSFADTVREFDRRYDLGPSVAHWMAVAAMEQYGLALAELTPGAATAVTADSAGGALRGRGVTVLLPYRWLAEADPLAHDWGVTSDSLAAWVAHACGARRLVLIKPTAALEKPLPSGAAAVRVVDSVDLPGWAAVDPEFPQVARGLEVWMIDGGRPTDLEALLETGACPGLRILTRP